MVVQRLASSWLKGLVPTGKLIDALYPSLGRKPTCSQQVRQRTTRVKVAVCYLNLATASYYEIYNYRQYNYRQ